MGRGCLHRRHGVGAAKKPLSSTPNFSVCSTLLTSLGFPLYWHFVLLFLQLGSISQEIKAGAFVGGQGEVSHLHPLGWHWFTGPQGTQ